MAGQTATVAIACICAATTSLGAAAELTAELVDFQESVQQEVSVSGTLVVGFSADTLTAGRDVQSIGVRVPTELSGQRVCLSVQTRDGTYVARNTYKLPAASSEPARLPYGKSNHIPLLKSYEDGWIAYALTPGDCPGEEQRLLIPINVRTPAEPPHGIHLMVNGLGATDVSYSIENTERRFCDPITDGRTTVFDFRCEIEHPDSLATTGGTITLHRERFGRELAESTVTIVGSGPVDQ